MRRIDDDYGVNALHDTFYGMREFIIRDLNRFWVTFGQDLSAPSVLTESNRAPDQR